MEKLKKLISHFKGYQKQAGRTHDVAVDIKAIPIIRKAAEEANESKGGVNEKPTSPRPEAPKGQGSKTTEKAPAKVEAPESVVDKLDDLDKYVKKIIDRELETTIKRVIEEIVRKELGKSLTQLEQGVRDEVQTEVSNQARNVERDIKHVAPGAPVAAPAPAKDKAVVPPPPPPPAPAPAKAATVTSTWLRKAKVPVTSALPKAITVDEEYSVQPDINNPEVGMLLLLDPVTHHMFETGFKIDLDPTLPQEDQVALLKGKIDTGLEKLDLPAFAEDYGQQPPALEDDMFSKPVAGS